MGDQTEIQMGQPEVVGIDPDYSGLLRVRIPLDPRPDVHWSQVFEAGPPGVSHSISMHPPRLSGGYIEIRPPDDEVEKYVQAAKERVEGTNRYYASEIAPKLSRQQEQREAEEADRQRRIVEAQRRLHESS